MSVYRTPKSPYWQYDFQHKGRRFHGSTGCTAKGKAEAVERKQRDRAALGEDRIPISLDDACKAYWLDKGQHARSHATINYQLANLCSIIGATKLLSEIGQADFERFKARRRATVSNASVNREWQLAKRVWSHAMAGGFDVPAPGTKRAVNWTKLKLKEPIGRARELLPREEEALFAALARNPDLSAVVEFAMLCGQRRESVVTLESRRVDLDGKRATIVGKGDKIHTFPLTARMVEIIEMQPGCAGRVFSYVCKRPAPLRKGRPKRLKGQRYPFTSQGWKREWRKALSDAGITDFRFHDLRHTTATRLLRRNGNLKTVQKLLNHSDISTTARYAHVLEDDLRAAMNEGDPRIIPGMALTDLPENGSIAPVSGDMG